MLFPQRLPDAVLHQQVAAAPVAVVGAVHQVQLKEGPNRVGVLGVQGGHEQTPERRPKRALPVPVVHQAFLVVRIEKVNDGANQPQELEDLSVFIFVKMQNKKKKKKKMVNQRK